MSRAIPHAVCALINDGVIFRFINDQFPRSAAEICREGHSESEASQEGGNTSF